MPSFSHLAPRAAAGLFLVVASAQCGARTSLQAEGGSAAGGAGGATTTTTSGGGGEGGEGGTIIPEPPCRLEVMGHAVQAIATPSSNASSPSIVAIAPESPGTPSHIAIQALTSIEPHPVNVVGRWRLAEDWPEGADIVELPTIFGIESHSWGATAPTPDGTGLAMMWFSDPGFEGRVAFRQLDFASWEGGPNVDLSFEGGGPIALGSGAGVGDFGVGHAGLGYAAVWRQSVDTGMGFFAQPQIAILDEQGSIQLGPHPLGPLVESPGVSPSIAWSGESYLIATSWGSCQTPDCPGELTLHRFRPASGDEIDDSGIDLVWSEDVPDTANRPVIASHEGRTWMAYVVGPDADDAPQMVVARELSGDGSRLGEPIVVDASTLPTGGLRLTAAPFGLVMMWATDGDDPSLTPEDVGYTQLQIRHLGFDGVEASPPLSVPATQYVSSGPTALAAVEAPRGIAFTWAGTGGGPDVAYLGLLRCGTE